MTRLAKIALAVMFAVALVIWLGVYTEINDCEAKGGIRLRGTWPWQLHKCYDTSTLKVLR